MTSQPTSIDTATLRRMAGANATALVLGYLPMARWEQRMRATGGPGIVGLQLARDASAARDVLATWGAEGRAAATEQTWADFVWMHTYGLTGTYLIELARRRTDPTSGWAGAGRVARWLPYAAVACDVIEGVGQLRSLRSWQDPDEAVVRMTRVAATAKYAFLGTAVLLGAGAATVGARRR